MQSVEAGIVGNALCIDLEMPLPRSGEEPAIPGIADQFLVAGFQLAAQTGYDGLAHGGVTARLGGIETNHVAARFRPRPPVADDHLLDLDVDLAATRSEWSAAPSARDRSERLPALRTCCARGRRGCSRCPVPRVRRSCRHVSCRDRRPHTCG